MKINTIIGVQDDYTSIYVWTSFNNQIIPLYFDSLENNSSILNGSVYDKKIFSNIVGKLLSKARNFLADDIKEVALCLDNFNVNIHDFDIEIELKNKVLTSSIWFNEILPNLQIKTKADDQYNYYFDVIKWKVGDKIIEKIEKEYFGDKVVIIGKKYIINKLIYDGFNEIIEKNGAKIINFNTTIDLYKSSKNKNELNVLVNKNNISITSIHNDHLMSNVICDNKGLNNLIYEIKKDTNIPENEIIDYLSNIDFFKKNPEICIANKINKKTCCISKINQSMIDESINRYTSILLELILDKIEYYKKEKNTKIDTINLISNSNVTQQIFNLFQIHSKYNFNIVKPNNALMYENKYIYCVLNAQKDLNKLKTLN